ncbi:MAG: sensor histidine kinase, partial [Bacteroidia bacterium]
MKLLVKTGIYYLVTTVVLFAAGGVLFYFSLQNIINESVTEHLYVVKAQVISYAEKNGAVPPESPVGTDKIAFVQTDQPEKEEIRDTTIYDTKDKEYMLYRTLIFPVKAGEKYFSAILRKPLLESDDLIESIAWLLGILAGVLLVALFVLNRWLSKKMWNPFYETIAVLKKFDLGKKETVRFSPVNISEFRILNEEIQKMMEKIQLDYRNLKEFTENASHEIQTPLAIIRSKLELMVQAEDLSAEQMKQVQDIYESTNRLSKLNQSLLLLAKIENRQFHETQSIKLHELIAAKLSQFEEMIAFKNIRLTSALSDGEKVELKMNTQLADILISNIIGNAIKHNINGGNILIELKNNSLLVSNSGNPLSIAAEKVFDRFQKGTDSNDSAGLGLAIV